ncbi:MAG: DegT/DnrJ/EryC1/StrS family aminotransferase [Planctomycetes bacterium]|nr:DegT/DnrJ/EryC1/StrS family aminotransferase [Planctomycetota bacterium]
MDGAIPITRPLLGEEECDAVVEALRSGWLTQGNRVAAFERAVADYVGARHAIACSSCTTALHLALHASGIGPGDEVIVPSMSFIASANSIRYVGATPVFADVEARTFNLDPVAAAEAITPRTRAILVVHQIGLPADLDGFRSLCARHGLLLLEDAACAIGAAHHGQRIGGERALACFSFHPRKVITTGEGGMITTCDDGLAARLRLLRQHAMSLSDQHRHASDKVLIEEYPEVGFNYRMTDLQAAVGIEQMKRLDGILVRRRHLAERYTRRLAGIPGIEPPFVPEYATPNYQSYAVRLADGFPLSRNDLMEFLLRRGIAARRGIMTSHRELAYQHQGRRLPITERASDQSLLLPLYPTMTEAEQDRVVAALEESHAARRVA